MKCRFNLNDKVQIIFRDEMVVGFVTKIKDKYFEVVSESGCYLGTYPNDVGNYVKLIK